MCQFRHRREGVLTIRLHLIGSHHIVQLVPKRLVESTHRIVDLVAQFHGALNPGHIQRQNRKRP
ncbi:hypothetical protein D3C73_1631220 [compost metagenome]